MKGMASLNRHIDNRIMRANSKLRSVRVRINGLSLTNASNTAVTLLNCDDDPDYDLGIDGTNVAEVPPHTAIVDIKLKMQMANLTSNNMIEWMIYKDPDAIIGAKLPSSLFTQDLSSDVLILRKYCVMYNYAVPTGGYDRPGGTLRIRNKALRRIGDMEDGDVFRMQINNPGASIGKLYLTGIITVREK